MKAEVGKRYRHYKNEKEYVVLAVAYHTETDEKLVIYQGQYFVEDHGQDPVFARPQAMWEETVAYDGKIVDRFTEILT